jgi:AraC family transcriptional regulator
MEFAGLDDAQLERVREDPAIRLLFIGAEIAVGEFHCNPGDPRWTTVNCSYGYLIAFPGTTVAIAHTGNEPTVASRNEVVLYNAGQCYRRGLVDPAGDHCVFLMVAPSLLAEILSAGGSLVDETSLEFSSGFRPVDARTFLLQRLIVESLRDSASDRLQIEESLYRLVAHVTRLGDARETRRSRHGTRKSHVRIVEHTKALIAHRAAERLSLAQIAREVHVSPFHLARIFRARTGFGIHEYRDQLRVRVALDRILEHDVALSTLALELGYASHSHFTDSFRRAFGVPPSAVRNRGGSAVIWA